MKKRSTLGFLLLSIFFLSFIILGTGVSADPEFWIDLEIGSKYIYMGEQLEISAYTNSTNVRIVIVDPDENIVYNKLWAANQTRLLPTNPSFSYGVYRILAIVGDSIFETWITLIDETGFAPVNFPISKTHNNIEFTLFGNWTLKAYNPELGEAWIDFTALRNIVEEYDMDIYPRINSNSFLVRMTKGSYTVDLRLITVHDGLKIKINGTLAEARKFPIKFPRFKKGIGNIIKKGGFILDYGDLSGFSWDGSNIDGTVSASFDYDPTLFASGFESGSFPGDGWDSTWYDAPGSIDFNVTASNNVTLGAYMAHLVVNSTQGWDVWGMGIESVGNRNITYVQEYMGLNDTATILHDFGPALFEFRDADGIPAKGIQMGWKEYNASHWNLWTHSKTATGNHSTVYHPFETVENRSTIFEFMVDTTNTSKILVQGWVNGTLELDTYRDYSATWTAGDQVDMIRAGIRYHQFWFGAGPNYEMWWDNVTISDEYIGVPPTFTITNDNLVSNETEIDDLEVFALNVTISMTPDTGNFSRNILTIDPENLAINITYLNATGFTELNDPSDYISLDAGSSAKTDISSTSFNLTYVLFIRPTITKEGLFNVTSFSNSTLGTNASDLFQNVFNLTIRGPPAPELLYGAGFNDSSPFVTLIWNLSSALITDFEIQNSSDGISFTFLASTTEQSYNDTAVSNGTYRYYRVRTRRSTGLGLSNSSFSNINLEQVYFVSAGTAAEEFQFFWIVIGIALMLIGIILSKLWFDKENN